MGVIVKFLIVILHLVPNWVPEPVVRPIGVLYLTLYKRHIGRKEHKA